MQKTNTYYKTKDGSCFYNVCHNFNKIIKITKFDKIEVDSINIEELIKCKKAEYNSKKNEYYRTAYFQWRYKKHFYHTVRIPVEKEIISKNDSGNYLVFHNGYIWELDSYGPYLPQVRLKKVDGTQVKWTNVKNCRNFIKK